MKVNVLGTEYTILHKKESEDKTLKGIDGYCDSSTKTIVLLVLEEKDMDKKDLKFYEKSVLRHELIHAFLSESGLESSAGQVQGSWAVNEEMVDWIAIQFPKMLKAFEEVGAL